MHARAVARLRIAAALLSLVTVSGACGSLVSDLRPPPPATPTTAPTPMPLSDLIRSGTIRVGFNQQNVTLVQWNDANRVLTGVGADMARELVAVMGVRLADQVFSDAAQLFDAGRHGDWDVAFVVANSGQAGIAYTRAFVEIDQTYLLPPSSPVQTVADVDRLGLRVAVFGGSALDRYLTQTLKIATIVRTTSTTTATNEVELGRADVVAASRDELERISTGLPVRLSGGRILKDAITANRWVIAVASSRTDLLGYVDDFVEHSKVTGFLRATVERNGVRGATVPAPGP